MKLKQYVEIWNKILEEHPIANEFDVPKDIKGKITPDKLIHKLAKLSESQSLQWQPIDTAPKDGKRFIAYDSDYEVYSCKRSRNNDMWLTADYDCVECYPTNWLPLPKPPKK